MEQSLAYAATRPLTIDGHEYQAGEPVNCHDLKPGRLQQLIEMRRVSPMSIDLKAKPAPESDKPAAPRRGILRDVSPARPEESSPAALQLSGGGTAPVAPGLQAIHRGFGLYDIMDGDQVVESGLKKGQLRERGLA